MRLMVLRAATYRGPYRCEGRVSGGNIKVPDENSRQTKRFSGIPAITKRLIPLKPVAPFPVSAEQNPQLRLRRGHRSGSFEPGRWVGRTRAWLGVGLSIWVLAAHASTPTNQNVKSTVLFMDWAAVFKGRLQPTIDPTRVAENGWKAIEALQNSWNVAFKTNRHGLEPYLAPKGVHITVETARKEPLPLQADQPWESRLHNLSVLQESGKLRCWYSVNLPKEKAEFAVQDGRAVETSGQALCYAESQDGVHWVKPHLGIYAFNGSKSNNIVSFANFIASVFRDDNGPGAERYKSFEFGKLPPEELATSPGGNFNSYCLYGLVSPDGYHWTSLKKPLIRHFCDTQNVGGYDPLLKKYVGYFRDHQGGRAISRSESTDFHAWPHPQPILVPGPEDDADIDYYSNCYTTYPGNPSRRLLFPAIYHQSTDLVDVRLALSNEGRAFSWVSHQPIIELGAPGQFDSATIYAVPDLIRRSDGKLALAYGGSSATHNEGYFHGFYTNYNSPHGFGWAVWDDGRLAGIEASAEGEFYTQSFRPEAEQIEINARTTASDGQLTFAILQNGQPIDGYSLTESIPLQGNQLWRPLRWKHRTDLAGLRGQKVQLHVRLNRAKIFGYRIAAVTKADASK